MLFLLIGYFILCLINKDIVIQETINSTKIWFFTIFSSMFVSLIIVDLMKNKFKNINSYIYMAIFSIIIGNPGISKIINDSNNNSKIKNKMVSASCFMSPFFIFSYFSSFGYLFILSYYIPNIIFMLLNNYNISNNEDIITFSKSINKNLNILLNILGVLIFCNVFSSIVLHIFKFNNIITSIISSSIEVIGGINNIFKLNDILLQKYLCLFFLSFGGLSIHLQINNIFNNFNYKLFIVKRVLIGIISVILYLILNKYY